jgi:hypothetical protein
VAVQLTPPTLTKALSKTFLRDATLPADIDGYLQARQLAGRSLAYAPEFTIYLMFENKVACARAAAAVACTAPADLGAPPVLRPSRAAPQPRPLRAPPRSP